MSINISRKDVFWGYFAQVFSLMSGIITLPLILKLLTKEEIGLNYLLITFGSLVTLFDFGFAAQFGRNISYIFSGAQVLKREGIEVTDDSSSINYRLLATMIQTARFVYFRISLMVLVTMLTLGSWYIYEVTDGFRSVGNTIIVWLVFSFSIFFEVFFSYYTALLVGKGMIMESRKSIVYSKLLYVVLAFIFLYLELGLLGVVIANLIAPFVNRILSYKFFFNEELKAKISIFNISTQEKIDLFKIVWHNSKRLGLVFIGSYAINKLGLFLAGLYLPLQEIASYGLMVQLVGIIGTVSGTFFAINQSRFSALRINKMNNTLLNEFAYSMIVYYFLYLSGTIFLLFICPWLLSAFGSNAVLPSTSIMAVFALIIMLEGNHGNFATLIVIDNKIPFVKSALIAGALILIGTYLILNYTDYGILGIVLVQGIVQVSYANWKWPSVVCKNFNIHFGSFISIGIIQAITKIKKYKSRHECSGV